MQVSSHRPAGVFVGGVLRAANGRYDGAQDVRTFLRRHASLSVDASRFLVTEDDILGVDWSTSPDSTPGGLQGVHAPLLIMPATGHYWVTPSEIAYDLAPSTDKTLAFVYGATHGFTLSPACEVDDDLVGDPQTVALEYIAGWLRDHIS